MAKIGTKAVMAALAAAALLVQQAVPAEAQRTRRPVVVEVHQDRGSARHGGRGFFMIGAQWLDLDELNGRLVDAGYDEVDETFVTLGGGGYLIRNSFLIGGEGHGALSTSGSTTGNQFRTTVGGGYGMLNVGYAVFAEGGTLVYPMVGLGGGGLLVNIEERSTPDFDDVLDDPRRGVNLTNSQLLASVGLGIDHVFGGFGRGGLGVGLRAGWLFAPVEGDWAFGRSDVAGGPDAGFTGPFVRLSIGGGSR
jgi:opacity protein-like surface antigen